MALTKLYVVKFLGKVMLSTIREGEAKRYVDDLYNDEKRNPERAIPELWEDWVEPVSHSK